MTELHAAPVAAMDPVAVYDVLRLRAEVFVVEQRCAYLDPDGRDLEDGALQLWSTDADGVLATLRILRDPDALRIGRVVAAHRARGTGAARELFGRGLVECERIDASLPVVLDAQAGLQGWYESFGFVRCGDEFDEDGIPHVPMRREPRSVGGVQ